MTEKSVCMAERKVEHMEKFIEDLSSSKPTPGGGGASALIGSLSASLCAMVANLTTGKKKYAQYQEEIEKIIEEAGSFSKRLYALIQADADAFEPLSKAYGIPKDDPERETTLESALKKAADVPMDIMKEVYAMLPMLEALSLKGSRLAVSDVGVAAASARAALEGAVMNVYINTKLMKDREYADKMNREADLLLADGRKRCDAVYEAVVKEVYPPEDREAEELRGMPVVKELLAGFSKETEELKSKGIVPKLCVVRVGAREDDLSYEKGIKKRFEAAGAEAQIIELPSDVTQEKLEAKIEELNGDDSVHGIMVFRPLPKHLSEQRIKNLVSSRKDVDCMGDENNAHVFAQDGEGYPPCTPQAVMEMLDYYGIALEGKKVVIVGRSMVVGKPLAMLVLKKNATVTICHTRTKNLAEECRKADIIMACAGAARMITKDFVRKGQIVIDVGINTDENGLCGDVDYAEVSKIAEAVTPVPGGVGTVTTSVLLKHTILSAWKVQ